MGYKVSDKGGDRVKIEPGTYSARCFRVVGIGTQQTPFGEKRQLIISWELPTELIVGGDWDGKPMGVHKFYTETLNERSNLRKDLELWRGRAFTPEELDGFELENLLGAPCLVTVVATETDGRKVGSVTAAPKGLEVPEAVNPLVIWETDTGTSRMLDDLPDWLRDHVMKSEEFREKTKAPAVEEPGDPGFPEKEDDLPI